MVLTKIEFQMVQFWVQIHDIGLKKFNEANVENTGNKIGKFIETEKEPEKTITCYLKIKVQVDANQSLLDGFWWTNSEGKENLDRSSMKGYRTSSMDVGAWRSHARVQTRSSDVRGKVRASNGWSLVERKKAEANHAWGAKDEGEQGITTK